MTAIGPKTIKQVSLFKDSSSAKATAINKWHVVSMKKDWKEIFTKQ